MTGTHDGSPVENPALMPAARLEVFKALPATDKFQLVLKGGTHFAFSDKPRYQNQRNPVHHRAIQAISLKFWEAYLGGGGGCEKLAAIQSADSRDGTGRGRRGGNGKMDETRKPLFPHGKEHRFAPQWTARSGNVSHGGCRLTATWVSGWQTRRRILTAAQMSR